MKAAYRTTLCSVLIFALRVVGVEAAHKDDSRSTDSSRSIDGSSSIGGDNRKERNKLVDCALVKCANPCPLQLYPCSEDQLCVPWKKNGCCQRAKCCRDPCKKKGTKAAKCQKDKEVCQPNYIKKTKNFCPTAECIDLCSLVLCENYCRFAKCSAGFVCRNTYQSPTDCCPSGAECVKTIF